jgi:hypothetical protein
MRLFLATITTAATHLADPSATGFLDLITEASGPTLMAIIVVGALREWWVPGAHFKRVTAQRDEILELLVQNQLVTERVVDTVARGTTAKGGGRSA